MHAAYLQGFSNGTVIPWTSIEIPNDMKFVMSWQERYTCKTCRVQHSIETSLGDWPTADGTPVPATLFTDITKDASNQGPLFAIPYHKKAWEVTDHIVNCSKEGTHAPEDCSVTHLVSGVNKALSNIGITGCVVQGPAYISFSDIHDGEWNFYPDKGALSTASEEDCHDCGTESGNRGLHVLTSTPGRVVPVKGGAEYYGTLHFDANRKPGDAILHAFISHKSEDSFADAAGVASTMQRDGHATCWASTLRSELRAAREKEGAELIVVKSHLYDHDGDAMELEED